MIVPPLSRRLLKVVGRTFLLILLPIGMLVFSNLIAIVQIILADMATRNVSVSHRYFNELCRDYDDEIKILLMAH